MPYYDYACRDCGHRLEIRQSFEDDPLTVCPNCQGDLRRVIAPVGIVFKGGGYYVTDTRTPAPGPGTATGSADENATGSVTEISGDDGAATKKTEAETKPASKAGAEGPKSGSPARPAAEGGASGSDSKGKEAGKASSN